MSTSNLDKKIINNYNVSKISQIYLTCKQLELLEKNNFHYVDHNVFYNEDLNIYTYIKNCYSFTNRKNHTLINQLNGIMYNEYINIEKTNRKKILKQLLKNIIKE